MIISAGSNIKIPNIEHVEHQQHRTSNFSNIASDFEIELEHLRSNTEHIVSIIIAFFCDNFFQNLEKKIEKKKKKSQSLNYLAAVQ